MKNHWFFVLIVLSLTIVFIGCHKDELEETYIKDEAQEPILILIDSMIEVPINVLDIQRKEYDGSAFSGIRSERIIIHEKDYMLDRYKMLDFYFTRNKIDPAYKYTAIITPIIGNLNLSVRSYVRDRQPPYRMIRNNYSLGEEKVSFTMVDMKPSENELNFIVQGSMGTKFKWLIYRELIVPVISENPFTTCQCGSGETNALICDNFENIADGSVPSVSAHFYKSADASIIEPIIKKGVNYGAESSGALWMHNVSSGSKVEANLNLGDHDNGTYILSWKIFVSKNKTAKFDAPKFGGKFELNGNGVGNLNLFGWYNLKFNYPIDEWVQLEMGFEPQRGLYRFKLLDRTYYWVVQAGDHTLDLFKFYGTSGGYKIDNICFEQYVK